MKICPNCHGEKQVFVILCGPAVKNRERHITCSTCNGVGEITDEHFTAIQQGRTLSDLRIHGGIHLSQREAAALLGMSGYTYSRLEHGDPELWAQHGERALSVLRAALKGGRGKE